MRGDQVPLGHHIGVGVVIHIQMELIRPDHAVYFIFPGFFVKHGPGLPEPRRFKDNLVAEFPHEFFIPGNYVIFVDGVTDVGSDMVFHLMGEDLDDAAVDILCPLRRFFIAGVGRFPGEPCPFITFIRGEVPGVMQPPASIQKDILCHFGKVKEVERHKEYFRIPEDVAAVSLSGEGPGADTGETPVRVSADQHMVDIKTQVLLEVGGPFDDDIRFFPDPFPGPYMVFNQFFEFSAKGSAERP